MAKSPMNHHLSREKAVQRYLAALEEGDFSTIDAVWQEAQNNPALEHLLFALHEAFPHGQSLLDGSENALLKKEQTMLKQDPVYEKETGSLHSFPSDQYPSTRPRRRRATLMGTLAAILLVAFIVGGFLAVTNWNDSHLAQTRPTSTPAPSATPRPAQLPPLCQVALPATYQTNTRFDDLLVLSQSDIWLVGSDSQDQVLVLHWNGAQWSRTPVPAPAGSSLSKLAASSANDIWAIGETDYGGGRQPPSHTLIEHWNGTHWSQVASPDLRPSTRNILQGMTVVARDNIWAVGAAGDAIAKGGYGPNTSPVVEHWDGARWQLLALPTIQSAGLNSVVALSANDVWAVGSSSPDNGNSQSPLIIHWDGQSWNQVETPAINGGAPDQLMKITADASQHLLILGFDQDGLPTLLIQNNGKWSSLSVPQTPEVAAGK
ncbi:MAG TPA: hypothetical protein VFN35_13040, partial [Ktedonobacteraceae bacterium]|nr:hypothetical protein [Ktedonobacteraceae bacterium]